MAHTARAYPGLCSMKQLGVLLLPPGWDASPSQGYPQQYVACTHLYTWVKRGNVEQSFLSKKTAQQWRRTNDTQIFRPLDRRKVRRANHYTTAPQLRNKTSLFIRKGLLGILGGLTPSQFAPAPPPSALDYNTVTAYMFERVGCCVRIWEVFEQKVWNKWDLGETKRK